MINCREWESRSSLVVYKGREIDCLPGAYRYYATALIINKRP